MVLSFKPQFEPMILSGYKIHTIRRDPHGRWKPGIKIHMATGVRTSSYECFCDKYKCAGIQKIHLIRHLTDQLIPDIYIDDCVLPKNKYALLANNDGFLSLKDFCLWFSEEEFVGKIIHWTMFRY